VTVDEVLGRLAKVKRNGAGWVARCPVHEDSNPSLSISEKDGRILLHCHAGCTVDAIVAAIGLELRDLFHDQGGGPGYPRRTPSTDQHSSRGCTLAAYAEAKGLDVAFLESLGVSEITFQRAPAVRFPYLSASGEELCVRYRVSLTGDLRVRTKAGNKHALYGLNRLKHAIDAGYVLLVEGESDAQTLWQAGYPAIGLPGATGWSEERDAEHFASVGTVYVFIEPDRGGETVLRRFAASGLRDRIRLVMLDDAKDVSELWLTDPDTERFIGRLEAALMTATPWAEHERVASTIRASTAWDRCALLAREPNILARFAEVFANTGVSGETRAGQLLYLIVTSRILGRPVSAAVKGPSAGGKSFLVESVTSFFPTEAVYALTAMSERALAYGTEPLAHRFLVLYEAAGLEDGFAAYIVRSLLSEGRVRYETVEKTSQGLTPRLIEREGPTGLITTTTAVALHPENETRLLSIPITDTTAQTKDVLRALARDEHEPPDLAPWIALQEWITHSDNRVIVPYAAALAELVPPVAVRLRRDFGAILNLIRAHALLHQATRDRDDTGHVIASIEDYTIVRELVADLVAEGVEATVPPIIRETVNTVAANQTEDGDGVSLAQLARALELDKAAASRRWQNARSRGYLKNLETRRGRPARIVLADPLPEDVPILPTPEALIDRCAVDRVQGEDQTPPPERDLDGLSVRPGRPGERGRPDDLNKEDK
jgi:hypothetical protein